MLSKHERYYGLGMDGDALVGRMRWKTDVMMAWAWSKKGLVGVVQDWTDRAK